MYKSRTTYWSNSKLAGYIRRQFGDFTKPQRATMEDWNTWEQQNQSQHPIIYWITEIGFNFLQDIVMFPLDVWEEIRVYIRNRFIDKIHILQTKLTPGRFYEFDTRLLHGAFNSLVDFVECDLAWMQVVFTEDKGKKYGYPFWSRNRGFRFGKFRCREAGLDYLQWEMTLINECEWLTEEEKVNHPEYKCGEPSSQAERAKEVLSLYTWWTLQRPNRIDPFDDGFVGDPFEEENRQYEEDNEMLIRLIKIRKSLWT